MNGGIPTDLKLADGECVVRRYRCAVHDNCAKFCGTVIPLKGHGKTEGTIVVTDRRLICHTEGGTSTYHQEMRLSDVTSLSGLVSKFGRSAKVPLALLILGILLIAAPYVYAVGSDVADKSGDYASGFNAGVQNGYYDTYLNAFIDGRIDNSIPRGYEPAERPDFPSKDYNDGFTEGRSAGVERATSDIAASKSFSEPKDLFLMDWVVLLVQVTSIAGAVLIILGSILYVISYRTRDWVSIRIGGIGDPGVLVSSATVIDNGTPIESEDTRDVISDLGAVILTIRAGRKSDLLSGIREVE